MICKQCGFENKKGAKFCTKCGSSLDSVSPETPEKSDSSKYIIIALIGIIIVLAGVMGYFVLNGDNNSAQVDDVSQKNNASEEVQSVESDDSNDDAKTQVVSSDKESKSSDDDAKTQEVSSNQESKAKSWELIGSYSGSGSGSKTINVPSGKILVKLSAYPIKNYATNHLYVSGSNGESGGVDWGSTSKVETRSDSFSYTSSSDETFTIDYYETVNWYVEFYRYQ